MKIWSIKWPMNKVASINKILNGEIMNSNRNKLYYKVDRIGDMITEKMEIAKNKSLGGYGLCSS